MADPPTASEAPRADTVEAVGSSAFRPGADPDAWIDLHAAAYQERPDAVLRELLQNAVDALKAVDVDARFIEVAVLAADAPLDSSGYHLVVRDAGLGMDEATLKKALGILGHSTKVGGDFIGQFGVGFYSTHAVCTEVAVLSRAAGDELTAWRYVPADKTFYALSADASDALLARDFENHPRASRRRRHGTSVYLRLDLERFGPHCGRWLKATDLATSLRRDCGLLASQLYVADYRDKPDGVAILDYHGRDLAERSLSLRPPWSAAAGELDEILPQLFEQRLPYHKADDYPKDWHPFSIVIDDGRVSGFLYLVDPNAVGHIDLYLKSMHVETAPDLLAPCCHQIYGLVDITPGEKLDARVLAARDHMVRNDAYIKVCIAVEDACLDLYSERSEALLRQMAEARHHATDPAEVFRTLQDVARSSTIHRVLSVADRLYGHILQDVPGLINELVTAPVCGESVKEAVLGYVAGQAPSDVAVNHQNLSTVLQELQAMADRNYDDARKSQPSLRQPPRWNPRMSREFFRRIGPHLPFMVHTRHEQTSGQVGFPQGRLSLSALRMFDVEAAGVVRVLTKGSPPDYLVRNQDVSFVIQPQGNEDLIALSIAAALGMPDLRLEFVTFEPDLFSALATRDDWQPLVDLLERIVTRNKDNHSEDSCQVDVRGYRPDYLPLLEHEENGSGLLVINGYNDLMQGLKESYRVALRTNDDEVVEIMALVLHELFHHASPAAIATRPPAERHMVTTRTDMLKAILSMVEKYTDLKFKA